MSERRLEILLVEGAKIDRCRTETNSALVERVWMLSRPPFIYAKPTVSARKQEVMRQILTAPKCPEECQN